MNNILRQKEDAKNMLVGTEEYSEIRRLQGYISALTDILNIDFTEESE